MSHVKLLVIFGFLTGSYCKTDYCEICPDHVLCQYTASGPAGRCRGYNEDAHLTSNEVKLIVNKINERRSFVARGLGRNTALPQAANMRTVTWSDELAEYAQRWVDQCDPTTNPDKRDRCRDMANMRVGQNIASTVGSTPGLNVKSFIDVWFMQALDYTGPVSYYNHSQDRSSGYFTQLIWAGTHAVGCGKARFFIARGKVPLTRLVCNFAPRGNVPRRPVYAIGFPATQCPLGTNPDPTYPGLCSATSTTAHRPTTHSSSVSSLLRILNLFNDSVTQEIDPIRIDIKQQRAKVNVTDDRRNQKTRHVFNRTNNAENQFQVPMMGSPWNPNINMSRRHDHPMHFDRGHSRIYHGQDFTDVTMLPPSIDDYRRHNQQECTRKGDCTDCATTQCAAVECATTCSPNAYQLKKCTRGQANPCCVQPQPCCKSACDSCQHHQHCQTTFPTTQCNYAVTTCECLPLKNPCQETATCPNNFRRRNDNSNSPSQRSSKSKQDFQYYDLFPNVALRHGGGSDNSSLKEETWLVNQKRVNGYTSKSIFPLKIYQSRKRVTDNFRNSAKPLDDGEYLYDSIYPSRRKKRNAEEDTLYKPFWRVEENKSGPKLKTLRYTTLSGISDFDYSEQVTEAVDYDDNTPPESDYERPVKEKFLSFDELMDLRRNNLNRQSIRRQNSKDKSLLRKNTQKLTTKKPAVTVKKNQPTTKKPTVTTKKIQPTTKKTQPTTKKIQPTPKKLAATTTSTTTKKPTTTTTTAAVTFPRIRYCTRQLTCTWTAPTVTGEDGVARPVGGGGGGSRTPPGYVEGCTRTSTCTRDFMQRNKLAPSENIEGSGTEPTPEDEDYCERRSLNVKRRDSGDTPVRQAFKGFTNTPTSPLPSLSLEDIHDKQDTHIHIRSEQQDDGCLCTVERGKIKRSVDIAPRYTYRDLFSYRLNKMTQYWMDSEDSLYNKSQTVSPYVQVLLILIMINLLFNKILQLLCSLLL